MADTERPRPLALRRQVNRLVIAGLVTTLLVPVGSTAAEYQGTWWPNLFSVATAVVAFFLLAVGLRLGPTKDARGVARRGVPAQAMVERFQQLPMIRGRGEKGPTAAQLVRLDLRVEAEGETTTRVRLRRWVQVDKLEQLERGAVLEAKILPGHPQDPALGLHR